MEDGQLVTPAHRLGGGIERAALYIVEKVHVGALGDIVRPVGAGDDARHAVGHGVQQAAVGIAVAVFGLRGQLHLHHAVVGGDGDDGDVVIFHKGIAFGIGAEIFFSDQFHGERSFSAFSLVYPHLREKTRQRKAGVTFPAERAIK